jgi:hypothetical protein
MNVVDILQAGVIGLGFLLALLAYHLLTKEQKQETPRSGIINSIYVFMFFSVVLCVIGIFSQTYQSKNDQTNNKTIQQETPLPETPELKTLFSYFVYILGEDDNHLCDISEFNYSEKVIDTDKILINGKIHGKLMVDNRYIDFDHLAYGYKNPYYLKISHDKGVGFLERNRGDYQGYWIAEVDDPDVTATICPWVLSPDFKGLSAEEAKAKWPILNEPCRPLLSLKDISK